MALNLAEVSDGSRIRDHVKVISGVVSGKRWKSFEIVEHRGKLLLGGVDENSLTTIIAEIGLPSPLLVNSLTLKEAMPRVEKLPMEELEQVFRLFIAAIGYLDGAEVMLSRVADRLDADADLVSRLNEVIRATKAEMDTVEARVTEEANARLKVANDEIARLKSEKAELQVKLEDSQRSKKKLREALERMKGAR